MSVIATFGNTMKQGRLAAAAAGFRQNNLSMTTTLNRHLSRHGAIVPGPVQTGRGLAFQSARTEIIAVGRQRYPRCSVGCHSSSSSSSSRSVSNSSKNASKQSEANILGHMQGAGAWVNQQMSSGVSEISRMAKENTKATHLRIFQTLIQHVWPTEVVGKDDDEKQESLRAIQERKQRVLFSLGLLVAGKAVTIQVPFLFKYLVDSLPNAPAMADAATLADPASLGIWPVALLLGYGASRAASSGFQEWRNAVFMHVAQDAIRVTARSVFDHVQQLDLQFHLSKNTGRVARIMERGSSRSMQYVLNAMVFHIFPTILEVSLVSGLLAWQFGFAHANVALVTVGVYGAFTLGVTQWRTKFRRDMNRLENQASSRVVDSLMNYETVHYFNNIKHEGDRFEESLRGYQEAALQAQTSLSFLNVGQAAIFSVGLTALMWLTTDQIAAGSASVGDLVLVNGLLFQLSVPLFFIGMVYREVRQGLIDMEQMYELVDTKSNLQESQKAIMYEPDTMGTALTMENVYFSYPSRFGNEKQGENEDPSSHPARPILQGTSLSIPQGSTVAVVGTSGCGKSTLLRLWYRFYDVAAGQVTVGGHDVRDLDLDSLRRSIAVIPQDTVLFHESIWYNLQYANLSASREEIVEAAVAANLHDTILSFPQGYDTVVGERGLKLSGGEKQRVAIARALLKKDAPILLCDEPTSALDSETEAQIMQNIKNIGRGGNEKTIVMVAHRLSTIQDSDVIIVMDAGRVVEHGSHADLLALNGKYSDLWRRQEAARIDP